METPSSFSEYLNAHDILSLEAIDLDILQMNITKQCNLNCKHCHVEASPSRTEMMSDQILSKCIEVAGHPSISTIDITGGAPEMHPKIMWLIKEMGKHKKRLILRSNLTILLDPKYDHLLNFFAENRVELVGSLPNYSKKRSDLQRGEGVFEKIIEAIKKLNAKGYGQPDSGLVLNLVHNPSGAYLPGSQESLEHEYRRILLRDYQVVFNNLFCLINVPIGRYLEYLKRSDNYHDYMNILKKSFNPSAAKQVMCRTTLSIDTNGFLYDCDFNQVLKVKVDKSLPSNIKEFNYGKLKNRKIQIDDHCFACTAGSGSSCQGSLAE